MLVVTLGAALVHHHGDGKRHADCPLCVFLVQPAIAGEAVDVVACGLPILPGNPPVSEGLLTALWFKAAPLGRAPPNRKGIVPLAMSIYPNRGTCNKVVLGGTFKSFEGKAVQLLSLDSIAFTQTRRKCI